MTAAAHTELSMSQVDPGSEIENQAARDRNHWLKANWCKAGRDAPALTQIMSGFLVGPNRVKTGPINFFHWDPLIQ